MSYARDPYKGQTPPIMADYADPPDWHHRPKSRKGCIGAVCALGVIAIVAIAIFQLLRENKNDRAAIESLQQEGKPERIADAFVNEQIDVERADHAAIDGVIQRILEAALREDGSVRRFIDIDAFMDQMRRSGEIGRSELPSRNWMSANIDQVTYGPVGYGSHKIATIQSLNEQEVLVYLHLWDEFDYVSQQRWWMVKSDDAWKLSDWEILDYGQSEATGYAILCVEQETLGVQRYYKMDDDFQEAERLTEEGNLEQARKVLQRAESRGIHAKFHDAAQVDLGHLWRLTEDWERAKQAFGRIKNARKTPGMYFGQAVCAYELEEHEEVLVYAQKYIDHVGRSPSPRSWMAEACEALDRDDEAIAHWTEVLQTLPDHERAMNRIAALLPASDSERLVELIQATSDPKATALRLTTDIYVEDDQHLLQIARKMIGNDHAYLGTEAFLTGQEQAQRYEYPEAAQSYLQATQAAQDPKRQTEFQYEYIGMMCTMDRALEGYRNAVSKQEAFDQITDWHDARDIFLEPEQLLELVSLHAEVAPNNPWLDYYRGEALLEQDNVTAAEEAYRTGRANTDDETIAQLYDFSLASIFIDRDEELLAYEHAANRQNVFEQLGDSLVRKGRMDDLRKLVEMHRKLAPDDYQIEYLAAQIEKSDGDFTAAIRRLEEIQLPPDAGYAEYEINALLYECLAQTNAWPAHFRSAEDKDQAFNYLSRRFRDDWRLDDLEQLIVMHSRAGLDASARLVSRADVARAIGNDDALIKSAEQLTPGDWETFEDYDARNAMSSLVDAYVRAGDLEKAASVAQRLHDDHAQPVAAALVALHKGNVARCEEILASALPYQLDAIYNHALATPLLADDRFAEVRRKHPRSLTLHGGSACYLLLNEKPTITDASLTESLAGMADAVDVQALPGEVPGWLVTADEARFVISVTGRMATYQIDLSPQVRSGIDEHSHTLEINLVLPLDARSSAPLIARIVGALASPDTAAVFSTDHHRIVPNPQDHITTFAADPYKWWQENGEPIYLHREASEVDTDQQPYWQQQRTVLAKQDEFRADPETRLFVKVEANAGAVSMPIWLRVIDVTSDEVTAEFLEPAPLVPYSNAGERVRVSVFNIEEWSNRLPQQAAE